MEKYIFLDSESVRSIWYDHSTSQLGIIFIKGNEYIYFDVPLELFERFKMADSAGRFVHRELVGKYEFRRI